MARDRADRFPTALAMRDALVAAAAEPIDDPTPVDQTTPIVMVGAPQCAEKLGCVTMYSWELDDSGVSFEWTPLGDALIGDNVSDRFGRSVAASAIDHGYRRR